MARRWAWMMWHNSFHIPEPRTRRHLRPSILRRASWWQGLFASLFGVVAVIIVLLVNIDLLPRQTRLIMLPLVVYVIAGTAFWRQRFERRAWDKVIANDMEICPACEYTVRGIDTLTNCPECGKEMTIEEIRNLWTQAHTAAKKKQPILRIRHESIATYKRVTYTLFILSAMLYFFAGILQLLGYPSHVTAGRVLYLLGILSTVATLVTVPLLAFLNFENSRS